MLGHAAQRFLVPPFILILLVALAMLFIDPPPSMPAWLIDPGKSPPLMSVVVAFLAASTGIFAIGFFIANISIFFARVLAFLLRKPRGFSTGWSNEAKRILEKMYHFKDFRMEAEQCEQCFLGEVASSHVLSWMRRRWEYFAINVNCTIACMVAGVLIPLVVWKFGRSVRFVWYVIVCVAALIFAFNSCQARREVIDMDNFLVRNFEKIRERRLAMESPGAKGHAERDDAS